MPPWKTPQLKQLARVITNIGDKDTMLKFLRDLCTLEELAEMSRRWEAVQLLNKKMSYRNIAQKTGLSTTTVSRIAHWLYHGEGGYRAALEKKKTRVKI